MISPVSIGRFMKSSFTLFLLFFVLCPLFAAFEVKNGDKIAFLGDSITYWGGTRSPYYGYIHLVLDGLKRSGIAADVVFAGVRGHDSNDMLARVERDVIRKKPQWMLLSCGVNDVWGKWKGRGVDFARYKKNIVSIVEKAQSAGIRVVILTASMIYEGAGNKYNTDLKKYNDFLRTLAKEKKCLLADINCRMQKEVAGKELSRGKRVKLTYDGVHMNGRGHMMMASVILETFGVPAEKVQQYRKEWEKSHPEVLLRISLKKEEYHLLCVRASEKKISLEQYLKEWITELK